MAKVQVVFGDEQGVYFSAENENLIQSFLEKYKSDLGEDFVKDFYNKYDDDIWLLECLVELEITTSSQEEKHKSILKLISKTVGDKDPGFSFGYDGFSDEFYSDFFNALSGEECTIRFDATVVGYGDGYTNCTYTLTKDGWNIDYLDEYVWDEDEESYEIKS